MRVRVCVLERVSWRSRVHGRVCDCVCVRACVRALRACVRACACLCVGTRLSAHQRMRGERAPLCVRVSVCVRVSLCAHVHACVGMCACVGVGLRVRWCVPVRVNVCVRARVRRPIIVKSTCACYILSQLHAVGPATLANQLLRGLPLFFLLQCRPTFISIALLPSAPLFSSHGCMPVVLLTYI